MFIYLAISIKKTPIFALSNPGHVAKPSLFFQTARSSFFQVHSFPLLPFPFLPSPVQPNSQSLLQRKGISSRFYSALALMCSLISGTSSPGPSSEQHRKNSLTLSSLFPFSQPRWSLLGEAWVSAPFPRVISEWFYHLQEAEETTVASLSFRK